MRLYQKKLFSGLVIAVLLGTGCTASKPKLQEQPTDDANKGVGLPFNYIAEQQGFGFTYPKNWTLVDEDRFTLENGLSSRYTINLVGERGQTFEQIVARYQGERVIRKYQGTTVMANTPIGRDMLRMMSMIVSGEDEIAHVRVVEINPNNTVTLRLHIDTIVPTQQPGLTDAVVLEQLEAVVNSIGLLP